MRILTVFVFSGIAWSHRISTQSKTYEEESNSEHLGDEAEVEAESELPDVQTLTDRILMRECLDTHAQAFPQRMAEYGVHMNEADSDSLRSLILRFWSLQDQKENHLSNYNSLTKIFHAHRDAPVRLWKAEMKNISSFINSQGFRYRRAVSYCDGGGALQVRECITDQAKEFGGAILPELPALVGRLLELEAVAVHSPPGFDRPALKKLRNVVSAGGVNLRRVTNKCKSKDHSYMQEIVAHLDAQLRSPAAEGRACKEDPARDFCPEGLNILVNRPINAKRGSAAFTAVYFGSWPFLTVAAPLVGGLIGAMEGGPAGKVSGVAAGNFFAHGPIPYGAPMGAVAYAIFSVGPRTCMCFPRECVYSEETSSCVISKDGHSVGSSNPFANSVPFMSTKCVPSVHFEKTCEMQNCDAADFMGRLTTESELFGKVGPQPDGGVYNCMSTSELSHDSLLVDTMLPGEIPNTPEHRNRIFEELGVEPKPDVADASQ